MRADRKAPAKNGTYPSGKIKCGRKLATSNCRRRRVYSPLCIKYLYIYIIIIRFHFLIEIQYHIYIEIIIYALSTNLTIFLYSLKAHAPIQKNFKIYFFIFIQCVYAWKISISLYICFGCCVGRINGRGGGQQCFYYMYLYGWRCGGGGISMNKTPGRT